MREIENGSKKVQSLIDEYSRQAAEAEQSGQHEQALRLASHVRQLKKYQVSSGTVSQTLKLAQGINLTNQAVMDILEASGGLADIAFKSADPELLGRMHNKMSEVNCQMQVIMEQNEMMMESLDDSQAENPLDGDEKYLKELLENERKVKKTRQLKDVDSQLDRLKRIRTEGK